MAKDAKIRITAKDATRAGFSAVKKSLRSIGKLASTATAGIGKMMRGVCNLAIAGIAGMTAMVKSANDFRKAMAEVNTVLVGGDIKELTKDVIDLSAELGVAKNELAKGLYQTLSAGIPADNAIDFLREATKAAIAGVTTTETAVTALTKVIDSYGMKAVDAGKISDIMFTTVKNGVITFEELAQGIGTVSGVASQAGVDFEDLMGVVATGSKTVNARQLFTGLRAAILAITKPGEELKKVFAELGVTGEQMIQNNGIAGALNAISDATGGSLEKMGRLIPSVEALPLILAVTGDNAKKVTDNIDAMTNAAGATNEAFEKMDQVRGWSKLWQQMLRPVTKLGLIMDKQLAPIAERIGKAIGDWQNSEMFTAISDKLKGFIEQAEKLAGLLLGGGESKSKALSALKDIVVGSFTVGAEKAVELLMKYAPKIGIAIAKGIALAPIALGKGIGSYFAKKTVLSTSESDAVVKSVGEDQLQRGLDLLKNAPAAVAKPKTEEAVKAEKEAAIEAEKEVAQEKKKIFTKVNDDLIADLTKKRKALEEEIADKANAEQQGVLQGQIGDLNKEIAKLQPGAKRSVQGWIEKFKKDAAIKKEQDLFDDKVDTLKAKDAKGRRLNKRDRAFLDEVLGAEAASIKAKADLAAKIAVRDAKEKALKLLQEARNRTLALMKEEMVDLNKTLKPLLAMK